MVRVKLGWAVSTKDHPEPDFVVLCRLLELPFPPFERLRLRHLFAGQDEPMEVIPQGKGFDWDMGQGCFVCELEGKDFPDASLAELLARLGPEWFVARNWPDEEPTEAAPPQGAYCPT